VTIRFYVTANGGGIGLAKPNLLSKIKYSQKPNDIFGSSVRKINHGVFVTQNGVDSSTGCS